MKKQVVFFSSITALAVLTVIGCKKDWQTEAQTKDTAGFAGWGISERSDGGPTVLGSKRTIPYRVDIIKQAYNNLYDPDISTLSANYLYVRFLPQSNEDVRKMLESGIEFWDVPLDYDVISWGEHYHDPGLADGDFTYQYAVVEVGTALPQLQYEVLEQLALVPEDCAIAQEAFRLSENAYEVPDQPEENPAIENGSFNFKIERGTSGGDGGGSGGECNCPLPDHSRKPSGCVQVFDNMLQAWEGVINVEVHTSKTQIFGAVFHRETETDNNGCWKINRKYYGKIHVWVKWENGKCDIKTMEGNTDLWGYSFPRKAYMGQFGGPNFNNIAIKFDFTNAIGSWNFRNWAASTVNNAVFEFGGFIGSQGITRSLPGNLKILLTPWGSGGNSGAAPMLDKIGFIQQFILFGTANSILTGVLGVLAPGAVPLALPLASWLEITAPDISLNFNDSGEVNSDDMRELAYHELSHALHFSQVGSNYWLANIVYIMEHLGYGDGTAPGAGRCSVIESWAYQIGMNSTHLRYGGSNSNGGNTAYNTWRKMLEEDMAVTTSGGIPHIPYGWEWDLEDNNPTNPYNEIENGLVTDRVSGITNAQIFSTMTSSMLSMPQMKAALTPFLPPTVAPATYNLLCAPYGF